MKKITKALTIISCAICILTACNKSTPVEETTQDASLGSMIISYESTEPENFQTTTEKKTTTKATTKATTTKTTEKTQSATTTTATATIEVTTTASEAEEQTYILNTSTLKFHNPTCRHIASMNDENKKEYTGTRDDIIADGYSPCGTCKP